MDLYARFVPGTFKDLELFKRFVLNWSSQVKKKPLMVVFDELVLGTKCVYRNETKKIIKEISKALPKNTFVFFAIAERTGTQGFSTTGYIIEPASANGKARYKVYPKLSYGTTRKGKPVFLETEKKIANTISKKPERKRTLLLHWLKRQARWEKYKRKTNRKIFPELEISGKKVRFAVCADVSRMLELYPADIIITPSKKIRISPETEEIVLQVLRRGQTILISSAIRKGKKREYLSPVKIFKSEKGRKGIVPLKPKRIYRI